MRHWITSFQLLLRHPECARDSRADASDSRANCHALTKVSLEKYPPRSPRIPHRHPRGVLDFTSEGTFGHGQPFVPAHARVDCSWGNRLRSAPLNVAVRHGASRVESRLADRRGFSINELTGRRRCGHAAVSGILRLPNHQRAGVGDHVLRAAVRASAVEESSG
jgi:hypothetical protein